MFIGLVVICFLKLCQTCKSMRGRVEYSVVLLKSCLCCLLGCFKYDMNPYAIDEGMHITAANFQVFNSVAALTYAITPAL